MAQDTGLKGRRWHRLRFQQRWKLAWVETLGVWQDVVVWVRWQGRASDRGRRWHRTQWVDRARGRNKGKWLGGWDRMRSWERVWIRGPGQGEGTGLWKVKETSGMCKVEEGSRLWKGERFWVVEVGQDSRLWKQQKVLGCRSGRRFGAQMVRIFWVVEGGKGSGLWMGRKFWVGEEGKVLDCGKKRRFCGMGRKF